MKIFFALAGLAAVLLLAAAWNWDGNTEVPQGVLLERSEALELSAPLSTPLAELPRTPESIPEERRTPIGTRNSAKLTKLGPGPTLRVVAADGGADLKKITVVESFDEHMPDSIYPRMEYASTLATRAKSPISLGALGLGRLVNQTLWIMAPGFAWQQVRLSPQHKGERVVALERAGKIEVRLLGDPAGRHLSLRLTSAAGTAPLAEITTTPGTPQLIAGLRPGNYKLRLIDKSAGAGAHAVLREMDLALKMDASHHISLTIPRAADAPIANVAFHVHLGEGWPINAKVTVTMRPFPKTDTQIPTSITVNCQRDTTTPPQRSYYGSASKLAPGQYRLTVLPGQQHEIIELIQGQPNIHTIEIPEAVLVQVRVMDRLTGALVHMETLHWTPLDQAGTPLAVDKKTPLKEGVAEFYAPLGPVNLRPSTDSTYSLVRDQKWIVRPGRNDLILQVERASGIRVSLLHDETSKRMHVMGGIRLKPLNSSSGFAQQALGWDGPGRNFWQHTPGPGTYLLSIRTIPGFEPIPERTLHIRQGEMLKVEVRLVPKGL